ncbi:MAG: glycosyltransferase [Bryobacterales bacterium]|nr:glycosyltransferase [Bryobacterales bacterium]
MPLETIRETGAFDRGVIASLRDVATRWKPDVIQTHAVKSHFLARWAGLPRIAPWVAFHHGYTWTSRKTRLYNELDRWSLPAASRVLTVSEPFREELVRKGVSRGKLEVLHNAIRPDWGQAARQPHVAKALREQWGIPEGRPVALIVGRLSLEKDHLSLLNAVHSIARQREIHLVIVGDGPERPRIEAAVEKLGLRGSVTLTGQQPTAEPFYGIADLAVLASRTEGSPNALLEAMAAEVPAVATTVGGIPEIVIDGQSALLVPPGNAEALADAMLRMLAEPGTLAQVLRTRARQLVMERHTPQQRVDALCGIYRALPARKGR